MRKVFALLLVVIAVVAIQSVAFAEGLTVYGGLSVDENSFLHSQIPSLTLGCEYSEGRFAFGGWCTTGLDTEGGSLGTEGEIAFSLYGSCRLLGGDVLSLESVLGCFSSRAGWVGGTSDRDYQIQSGAAGARCVLNLDSASISAVYLVGVNNRYREFLEGFEMLCSNDLDSSFFELRGGCRVTDGLDVYVAYRALCWDVENLGRHIQTKGLGLGIQYAF